MSIDSLLFFNNDKKCGGGYISNAFICHKAGVKGYQSQMKEAGKTGNKSRVKRLKKEITKLSDPKKSRAKGGETLMELTPQQKVLMGNIYSSAYEVRRDPSGRGREMLKKVFDSGDNEGFEMIAGRLFDSSRGMTGLPKKRKDFLAQFKAYLSNVYRPSPKQTKTKTDLTDKSERELKRIRDIKDPAKRLEAARKHYYDQKRRDDRWGRGPGQKARNEAKKLLDQARKALDDAERPEATERQSQVARSRGGATLYKTGFSNGPQYISIDSADSIKPYLLKR